MPSIFGVTVMKPAAESRFFVRTLSVVDLESNLSKICGASVSLACFVRADQWIVRLIATYGLVRVAEKRAPG
jgi:hypothetical protein